MEYWSSGDKQAGGQAGCERRRAIFLCEGKNQGVECVSETDLFFLYDKQASSTFRDTTHETLVLGQDGYVLV